MQLNIKQMAIMQYLSGVSISTGCYVIFSAVK